MQGSQSVNDIDCRPVIFGEVLYDCFPDGEAVLGGAPFNVAWHLQGLGLSPLFISRVGDDPLGHRVRDIMERRGMDTSGLQLDSAHPTGKVNISLSGSSHSFDIIPDQAYDYIAEDALPPLPDNALFYHGSLAARSPVSARTLSVLCSQFGDNRLVDVNLREPWWQRDSVRALLDGARLAKLNDEELLLLASAASDDKARMRQLIDTAGLQLLVVTHGASGAELMTGTGEVYRVVPETLTHVVDTVGAGDALTSVLILGLLKGWSYAVMLERSQAFASAIVGHRGATVEAADFYRPFIETWNLS
jgi:fructokinase